MVKRGGRTSYPAGAPVPLVVPVNVQSPALDSQMQEGLQLWMVRFVNDGLPPGSYVARVEEDPCVDELGLEIRWVSRAHLVVGRLAREDLLE